MQAQRCGEGESARRGKGNWRGEEKGTMLVGEIWKGYGKCETCEWTMRRARVMWKKGCVGKRSD